MDIMGKSNHFIFLTTILSIEYSNTFFIMMDKIFFKPKKLNDVENDNNLDNGFACAYKEAIITYIYLTLKIHA